MFQGQTLQGHRIFFENKVQEDKERKELERSLEESVHVLTPVIPPPPPPPPPTKKKGQKPGRRDTLLEKPIIPSEPPEPVLHGSMAIGAVSLAVAKTSASLASIPLYMNIVSLKHGQEQPSTLTMPLLMGSVLSCGKSSPGKLNLMKEVICIPHPGLTTKQGIELLLEIQKQVNRVMEMGVPRTLTYCGDLNHSLLILQQPITGKMSHLGCLTINYDTIEQPLLLIQGICTNLGLELGISLHLAINCAAHELMDHSKGKYEVMAGTYKNTAEMVDLYVDLINKYPSIIALIDPFRKEDAEQWDSIYNALASRCYIIAGAASRSVSKLLENRNISTPKSHGLIINHTNQTTMSDLVEITHLIDGRKQLAVFGSTEAESCDDSLVDLAVGLSARFIKLGGLSRGERVTKYNRLLAIEEELIQSGTWGSSEEHNFSSFQEDAATMAEETLGPLDSIFPTEVVINVLLEKREIRRPYELNAQKKPFCAHIQELTLKIKHTTCFANSQPGKGQNLKAEVKTEKLSKGNEKSTQYHGLKNQAVQDFAWQPDGFRGYMAMSWQQAIKKEWPPPPKLSRGTLQSLGIPKGRCKADSINLFLELKAEGLWDGHRTENICFQARQAVAMPWPEIGNPHFTKKMADWKKSVKSADYYLHQAR
ncbi:hypothetical protein A6R68_06227, partial [Neotoma lepida]